MPWKSDPILQAGGTCGALMRALDWSHSPLGQPDGWSPELRTVVGIALGSQQPMLIVWGPDQITLYNDGYATMCGNRHPAAMGRPFRDLWFDIWDAVDPIISAAYAGTSTSMDDIEFVMHRNGYPEETHFSFSYTPVRSPDGTVLGMFCACAETTHTVIRRREQDQERERWRKVAETALGAVAVMTGPDHVVTFANDEYRTMVGDPDPLGRPVAEALPEIVGQGFVALLDKVFQSGEPEVGRGVSARLRRHPGGALEHRFVDFRFQPIRDGRGEVHDIFVQALDVTEQHVLNRELGHRLKNQLAIVQAVVNQTLLSAPDLPAARHAARERLAVLGRAHDTLIAGEAHGATVREVVLAAIPLHQGEDRFTLAGPDIAIAARAGLSLSLIVHELVTNAIKYGALSQPEGRVAITWQIADTSGPALSLVWCEAGGPPVVPPTRTGTGSRLIRSGLGGGAGSQVTLDYRPEGVVCTISATLIGIQTAS